MEIIMDTTTATTMKRWQDLGNIVLGAWLFVSPWAMAYEATMRNAALNAHIVGLAIVIFAAVAVYIPRAWEEWINVLLGLWAIASPWALGFSAERNIAMNAIIVGILVVALAAWAMVRDKTWQREHHVVQ